MCIKVEWDFSPKSIDNELSNSQAYIHAQALKCYQYGTNITFHNSDVSSHMLAILIKISNGDSGEQVPILISCQILHKLGLKQTSHAYKLKWSFKPKAIDNGWSNSQIYIHVQAL